MNKILFFLFPLCASIAGFSELPQDLNALSLESGHTLIVNNRVLATVNGKKISILDIVKKMDVFLNQYYPQYADSVVARYQFYMTHWRETLNRLVDAELVLMDAEGKELKLSEGEVREAIHDRFGPNVMTTLDKLGLTFEEARSMIHTDLIVQRMTWFKVNSKAFLAVHPEMVKSSYKEYCVNNPPSEHWDYQVLSVRSKDPKRAEDSAYEAYSAFLNSKAEPSLVVASLKEQLNPKKEEVAVMTVNDAAAPEEVSLSLSEAQQADSKTISSAHREVLATLQPGSFSLPIRQKSRVDNSTVYRIFFLKSYEKTNPLTFPQLSEKLENELLQQAMDKESQVYTKRLREKYSYEVHVSEEEEGTFTPFILK